MLLTLTTLFFLTYSNRWNVAGSNCADTWFDCGNGECIAHFFRCDNDNDCGNLKDEEFCESGIPPRACLSSQFQCLEDGHCIADSWHCDGEQDCDDGSDEINCENNTHCHGFRCKDNHCIPEGWKCDGREDCSNGEDEDQCPKTQVCGPNEFTCLSGSCIAQKLVCNGLKDCPDASDENKHCSDVCVEHACSQKCRRTPKGPECFCDDGFKLATDNKTCSDIDECLEEGICSQICTNLNGSHACSCLDGYGLEHGICKASGPEPILIFSTMEEMRAMYLRTKRYTLVHKAVLKAGAVDADPLESKVYWVEISNKSTVYSSNIDGTGFKTVLTNGLMIPEDIAVDYVARNLYFTDSGLKQILACKMDGTMCHVLHSLNIMRPRSIAVDPPEGLLYWSDWGDKAAGIYRSGMDGSRKVVLVSKDIYWPNGITLDHTTNRLFWADAYLMSIEYITLDGKTRKVLLKEKVYHPYSLAVFEDSLYWSDWDTFSLETCNKFTSHQMNILTRENGKHIMGVHVYHPVQGRRGTNPCWSNSCSHMCLIAPLNGYKCACPPGFSLSSNGRTCSIDETFPMVFVNDETRIFHVRPETVGSTALAEYPISHFGEIGRLAYDWDSKVLYVADLKKSAIYSVNTSTLVRRELVKNHVVIPEDIAFDSLGGNLYWVDSSKGTVEVISPKTSRMATLIVDLTKPMAIALEPKIGRMFVSTTGSDPFIAMFDMDGKNKVILNAKTESAIALAVHPSASLLYWADPQAGKISYLNYHNPRNEPKPFISLLGNVMSLAVSEKYIYWTDSKNNVLNFLRYNTNISHMIALPGSRDEVASRKVLFASMPARSSGLHCNVNNGGCSYLCLITPKGRSCVCPSGMELSSDGLTCKNKNCTSSEFQCKDTKKCIPKEFVCDKFKDCVDGSDEACDGEQNTKCPVNDFRCANGHCIMPEWKCDFRDDCGDNSDEIGCPEPTTCAKDYFSCSSGECVPTLWRCDGTDDCTDGSDEKDCHTTACDVETQIRCDHGQCLPISWGCDGTKDCIDGTDERNCTKQKVCSSLEFQCDDGFCVDKKLVCDQRNDCQDGSDERNCTHIALKCEDDRFTCKDNRCIFSHEKCDGHKDCTDGEDEVNCTQTAAQCNNDEYFCTNISKCIPKRWICDGDNDCGDEADEEPNYCMNRVKSTLPPYSALLACEEFFCKYSGECISWLKVCNGHSDCSDMTDEGHLCYTSCQDNGGCSQTCTKTPEGSKCSCYTGYRLSADQITCEDIDECTIPGYCSHFCNNTKGGFKCSCSDGYLLSHDLKSCRALGEPATLVYLQTDEIKGFELRNSHSLRLFYRNPIADMRGIDYDASDSIFFWSDWKHGTINSYTPNTNKTNVLVTTLLRPHYLKWDWNSRNLYYTDDEGSIIACVHTGKFCATVIKNAAKHINSFDISPQNGYMFWTVFDVILDRPYGVIERAELDGSHRIEIITENTHYPASITVDHDLKRIYWVDANLNVIESADFNGQQRRIVLSGKQLYPRSMALFEDYIYYSNIVEDLIYKCGKFNGDCVPLQPENVKADVIVVVHKVNQKSGRKPCLGRCSQVCLPSNYGTTCKCADGYQMINSSFCQMTTTEIMPSTTYKPKLACPDNYCERNAECKVFGDQFYCQCPDDYFGEHCEKRSSAAGPEPTADYSWVVGVLLAIIVICSIISSILLCKKNRDRLSRMSENVAVTFRKAGLGRKGSRLMADTDDGGACDELMLGRSDDLKPSSRSFGNPLFGKKPRMFSDPESKEGDFKRWPSFDSGDSAFVSESPSAEDPKLRVEPDPLRMKNARDRLVQFFSKP